MIYLDDCPLDVAGAPHCPWCGSTNTHDVGQQYHCLDCRKLGVSTPRGVEASRRFALARARALAVPGNLAVLLELAKVDRVPYPRVPPPYPPLGYRPIYYRGCGR